jgi:catechol 2,3-dioxygenase-like lactoylglutathione lyase family enzyme
MDGERIMRCHIGYVNVGVRDLERAIAFYRDVLGFTLVFSEPAFHYARFDIGGFRFAIAASEVDHFSGGVPGNRHTGIGLTVADVNAAAEELMAKGVEFPMKPAKQPWGGYMGIFADPDGNLYYLDQEK